MGATVRGFLDHLTVEAGLSVNTVLAYGRDLKAFLEFCAERHVHEVVMIDPTLIQAYMQDLSEREKSENTIKRFLVAVRLLLRHAKLRGMIADDYAQLLDSPKIWSRLPIVCSPHQDEVDGLGLQLLEDRYRGRIEDRGEDRQLDETEPQVEEDTLLFVHREETQQGCGINEGRAE